MSNAELVTAAKKIFETEARLLDGEQPTRLIIASAVAIELLQLINKRTLSGLRSAFLKLNPEAQNIDPDQTIILRQYHKNRQGHADAVVLSVSQTETAIPLLAIFPIADRLVFARLHPKRPDTINFLSKHIDSAKNLDLIKAGLEILTETEDLILPTLASTNPSRSNEEQIFNLAASVFLVKPTQ